MACRTARAKRDLQRVVRTPEGTVVLDPSGRMNGRGAYVCVGTDCLSNAIKKGALARALETQLPPTFLASVGPGADPTITTEGGPRGQE
ncbi:MAG TPA: YlxR family protein [Candidatus Limnocylindrales bacterium]|nr:YlxR family protein [Candidatus Limnocylindrales bacterium]